MNVSTSTQREQLTEELLGLLPLLRKRIESNLPALHRPELGEATAHQMEAVGCLLRSEGLTMNELAQAQGCALSTATALADRLLRAGLVERIDDPEDRRIVRLLPTQRAREMKADFMAAKLESVSQLLGSLSLPEMTTLVGLLRKVAEHTVEVAGA